MSSREEWRSYRSGREQVKLLCVIILLEAPTVTQCHLAVDATRDLCDRLLLHVCSDEEIDRDGLSIQKLWSRQKPSVT
jgi:hypothetical protein